MSDVAMGVMVRKLETRVSLDDRDRRAILDLPHSIRSYEPPAYIMREGTTAIRCCSFVLSGFAFRQKLTVQGAREIISIHLPGDFLDLQHLFLRHADHNVQALTHLSTVELDRSALQQLALSHPAIAQALWTDTLIEASIYREWLVNVGRRDARQRIAHLLCEFEVRMKTAGLTDSEHYELPMTQEQLGDALGLTSVHVNRMLKMLVSEKIVSREGRKIRIVDGAGLRAIGDFSALYLHLDQATTPLA